jgi:hypothetical protein
MAPPRPYWATNSPRMHLTVRCQVSLSPQLARRTRRQSQR